MALITTGRRAWLCNAAGSVRDDTARIRMQATREKISTLA